MIDQQPLIQSLCNKLQNKTLKELFAENPNRFRDYNIELENILFDYSKNFINEDLIGLFVALAKKHGIEDHINDMFTGKKINFTEDRAVLHTLLRNFKHQKALVDGVDYSPEIESTFNSMAQFAENVRNKVILSSSGKPFKNIVSIGIGGSSLPVQMSIEALREFRSADLNAYFVSNVDYANLRSVIDKINPEETMVFIVSKTFTTTETMLNAQSAKEWLLKSLNPEDANKHLVAISTNIAKATEFGVAKDRIFGFWDFVGGRYSLWSSVGLPLMVMIGKSNFEKFLYGAKIIDDHFRNVDLASNIPFLMAVISIIYRNFLGYSSTAVLPYSHDLRLFPNYLQQVCMESNGKSVDRSGHFVEYNTSPVLWGGAGTDVQHSFFQMIHQGTNVVPVDFIGVVRTINSNGKHHLNLIANLIAQSEALMNGKSSDQAEDELKSKGLSTLEIKKILPHKVFRGNRPSNTILIDELNPKNLGMLCALYEHKYFVEGFFWQINSYDQWGVELGKELAQIIVKDIGGEKISNHDSSTSSLIRYYKARNVIH